MRHPESGYGESRQEIQARLREAKKRLKDYRESQEILGGRDFSRDYERRLQEGVARQERELERIDGQIVDAILADEAAAAARRGLRRLPRGNAWACRGGMRGVLQASRGDERTTRSGTRDGRMSARMAPGVWGGGEEKGFRSMAERRRGMS